MVRIRLRRVGARNQPSYRIVAADKRHPRDGRFLEILGHYNPRTHPATVQVDEARLYHWLKNGAQPSDSVRRLLKSAGMWSRWERYKQGESLESVLEEADKERIEVDPRTRRDDLQAERTSKTSAERAEAVEVPEASQSEVAPEEPEAKAGEESGAEAESFEAGPAEDEPELSEEAGSEPDPEAEDS